MAPDKMAFEQRFSDDSGVESAVRYDASSRGSEIEIADVSREVSFPITQVDWLIEALQKIRDESKADENNDTKEER